MQFVCKAITITVVILFVALVGFYLWCFTSFRLYFNLLDAPTLEFETTWFDRSKNETYIFLKSDIPLEEFDGSSYLRLLGREAADSLPYSKYFKDNILIDNVVLDCSSVIRRRLHLGNLLTSLLFRVSCRVIQFMLDYSLLRPTDIHSEVTLLE